MEFIVYSFNRHYSKMAKIFYILSYLTTCISFNLDINDTIWRFNGRENSSFGYSLSLHSTGGQNSVLVGAPLYSNNGGLYKCIDDDQCQLVNVGNKSASADTYTSSMFGSSITSNGDSVLSCGHLWASRLGGKSSFDIMYKGQCVLASKNLENTLFDRSACLTEAERTNTGYDYCISGFSSTGFKTSDNVPFYFIGAPGATSYKGVVYGFYGGSPFQIKAKQIPEKESSHLGYSVAWGRLSNSKYGEIVSGAPRDSNLKGKIFIYSILGETTEELRMDYIDSKENPNGQIGSYYGASLCVVDLDNDGKDDLLVGAPRYSKVTDEGRVYIYLSRKKRSSVVLDLLKNWLVGEEKAHSRFGTVIANIGDMNNDGYPDIAVGAPNKDNGEMGAVYLYNGGQDGLRSFIHSQVIYASDIPNVFCIGFGKSIVGGMDIDGNEYPDIAIGAPQSNKAFLFRSSPLITLSDKIEFNVTAVPFSKSCLGPDGNDYRCVELKLNLQYEGKGTQNEAGIEINMEFDSQFRLDISKRAFVMNEEKIFSPVYSKNITLRKNMVNEFPLIVYFTVGLLTDVTKPVTVMTKYMLYKKKGGCNSFPCPILDQFGTTETRMEISYLRECGDDKICRPEVSIEDPKISFPVSKRTNQKDVIYGDLSDKIDLVADISNEGENAYNAIMRMNFSSDFKISNVMINERAELFYDPVEVDNFTLQVQFPLANPIRSFGQVRLKINFRLDKQRPSFSRYTFALEALSFGNDTDSSNNVVLIDVGAKIKTCVRIQGETSTPRVIYPDEPNKVPDLNPSVQDLGPEINYTFFIQNAGRLTVDELLASIKLADRGEVNDVLYVVGISVDGLSCRGNDVNPLDFLLAEALNDTRHNSRKEIDRRRKSRKNGYTAVNMLTSCPNVNCREYLCRINSIDPGMFAKVVLQTRFWEEKAVKLKLQRSDIDAEIKVIFNGIDASLYIQGDECNVDKNLKLSITPAEFKNTERFGLKWWIVLLSVIVALIILAVIAAILFWTGFFQREKSFKELQEEADVIPTSKANPNFIEDDDED